MAWIDRDNTPKQSLWIPVDMVTLQVMNDNPAFNPGTIHMYYKLSPIPS